MKKCRKRTNRKIRRRKRTNRKSVEEKNKRKSIRTQQIEKK